MNYLFLLAISNLFEGIKLSTNSQGSAKLTKKAQQPFYVKFLRFGLHLDLPCYLGSHPPTKVP